MGLDKLRVNPQMGKKNRGRSDRNSKRETPDREGKKRVEISSIYYASQKRGNPPKNIIYLFYRGGGVNIPEGVFSTLIDGGFHLLDANVIAKKSPPLSK